jgi:hypothetical protein
MIADNKQRHERLRLLIKKLNQERKRQAQKIDILCNDLIAAQRNFIERLNTISFTANFYESILGSTDPEDLLYTAARMIKAESADANVTFFLRHEHDPSTELKAGFELHMFDSGRPILFEGTRSFDGAQNRLENGFSPELMDSICKSNKVCTLDDMFAMGLQGNLTELNRISAVTIPLGRRGCLLGFMLLYRSSENKLTNNEIDRILAITGGLSHAITSCLTLSRAKSSGQLGATD